MNHYRYFASSILALSVLSAGASAVAQASTLYVNCGGKTGFTTINAALRQLRAIGEGGANTILVSGSCNENISIKNMDRLTLATSTGASITDASNGTRDVVLVYNSHVTISGFSIFGNPNTDGIDCYGGTHCELLNNTVQGASDGIGIYRAATAVIAGGVLLNNDSGVNTNSSVAVVGSTIQGNSSGVTVRNGGAVSVNVGDPATDPVPEVAPSTIAGNGTGVTVLDGGAFRCGGCFIRNNSGYGIHADVSAAVLVVPAFLYDGSVHQAAITGNVSAGVYLGDLSSGDFRGHPSIGGNGQPDVACTSPTSVSRGAVPAVGTIGTTSCSN